MAAARYLLDTHAALWWWRDIPRLSPNARAAIEDGDDIFVSAISAFEVGLKWRLGKLAMIDDPTANYPLLMVRNNFIELAVSQAHALAGSLLPGDHRDPFDRIIAAQALAEDMTVITCDPQFPVFGCRVLW